MSMMKTAVRGGLLLISAGAGAAAVSAYYQAKYPSDPSPAVSRLLHNEVPSRAHQLQHLAGGTPNDPFDILVIGGGATGTGCAVDAATRGLRTALVEREDFGSGTSSKSTKLVHGGVRYLEKAVFNLDYGQLKLVFEALHERKRMLENAPHLCTALPIMTPCYKWWEVPYYWAGLKAYDLVAGTQGLTLSRFTSASEAQRQFPTLAQRRPNRDTLKGAIVYYDGQFDDARLNVSLACTAALAGAAIVNYAEVTELLKDDKGQIVGARVRDVLRKRQQDVYARQVINATGPFSDSIRKMSDADATEMIMASAGVHVTLPDYYSPEHLGMIVPKTQDGRVVFMLPWLDATIAGTTDSSTEITARPQPTEKEIQFILDAIAEYLQSAHYKDFAFYGQGIPDLPRLPWILASQISTVEVRRSDVQSAWSGLRPLAMDPNAADTASASRDHIVTQDPDGLITVTGGKWTTYRLMAEDAIDKALAMGNLHAAGPCRTKELPLMGAQGYTPALFTDVAQHYRVPHRPGAIDTRVARYLAAAYGDRAKQITRIAEEQRLGKRLVRGHPMLEAEVVYACRQEFCEHAEDFIARRTRLAFLDTAATEQALPQILDLMAQEKGWWWPRRRAELKKARQYLATFHATPEVPARAEIAEQADAISSPTK